MEDAVLTAELQKVLVVEGDTSNILVHLFKEILPMRDLRHSSQLGHYLVQYRSRYYSRGFQPVPPEESIGLQKFCLQISLFCMFGSRVRVW